MRTVYLNPTLFKPEGDTMDFTGKRIGIWGYGITGRSTVEFARKRGACVSVMDKNPLADEADYFAAHGISFVPQDRMEKFFATNDLIIPSAGIDLRPYYEKYKNKWLFELDIFAQEFKKPYIAITGSVGKTSITSLLSQLLKLYGKKIATGGNIGIASLDLLSLQDEVDLGLLEVSSFQLEYTTQFAPELAVITNIIENHLDRHGTMKEYTQAKFNLIAHAHQALMPQELMQFALPHQTKKITPVAPDAYEELLSQLPPITFDQNWCVIIAILDKLGLSLAALPAHAQHLIMPEHRIEYVATIRDVQFYNDSKSTAPTATLAAVQRFCDKPIHLLLGGLSKGIDREPLIQQLNKKVKTVYCFGKEAKTLQALCAKHQVPALAFPSLEQAVAASSSAAQPGDIILLSPAGSSYDLFENFEHRGRVFKGLVKSLRDT
jgi:UDP-N-acetylmuramoylalanine--D-glutamate ligase